MHFINKNLIQKFDIECYTYYQNKKNIKIAKI